MTKICNLSSFFINHFVLSIYLAKITSWVTLFIVSNIFLALEGSHAGTCKSLIPLCQKIYERVRLLRLFSKALHLERSVTNFEPEPNLD
jgi:hypothetical protein